MIFYLSPVKRDVCISGGTRKLFDHVAILQDYGFAAKVIYNSDLPELDATEKDVVVVPEVYGDGLKRIVAPGVPRISFVQNPYLVDMGVMNPARHPFEDCPELVAVFTESQHTTDILGARFPELSAPLIRTHSSGNGRDGEDAGFFYGEWPRAKEIVYFGYKHESVNADILAGLDLPTGWSAVSMTGMTDAEIAEKMRTASIFMAANTDEGMCAPTSEAMIAGAVIVCWTGGGPDEYLQGRAAIAVQDDVPSLRYLIVRAAEEIDRSPETWAKATRIFSDWFQETYSRKGEIEEICGIFEELGYG